MKHWRSEKKNLVRQLPVLLGLGRGVLARKLPRRLPCRFSNANELVLTRRVFLLSVPFSAIVDSSLPRRPAKIMLFIEINLPPLFSPNGLSD